MPSHLRTYSTTQSDSLKDEGIPRAPQAILTTMLRFIPFAVLLTFGAAVLWTKSV